MVEYIFRPIQSFRTRWDVKTSSLHLMLSFVHPFFYFHSYCRRCWYAILGSWTVMDEDNGCEFVSYRHFFQRQCRIWHPIRCWFDKSLQFGGMEATTVVARDWLHQHSQIAFHPTRHKSFRCCPMNRKIQTLWFATASRMFLVVANTIRTALRIILAQCNGIVELYNIETSMSFETNCLS